MLGEAEKWRTGDQNYTADGSRAVSLYWAAASGSGPAAASALNQLAWLHLLPQGAAAPLLSAPPPSSSLPSSSAAGAGNPSDSSASAASSSSPPSSSSSSGTPTHSWSAPPPPREGGGPSGSTEAAEGRRNQARAEPEEVAEWSTKVLAAVVVKAKDWFGVDLSQFWLIQLGQQLGWWGHSVEQGAAQGPSRGGDDLLHLLVEAHGDGAEGLPGGKGPGSRQRGGGGGSSGQGRRTRRRRRRSPEVSLALWRAASVRGHPGAQQAVAAHLASPAFLGLPPMGPSSGAAASATASAESAGAGSGTPDEGGDDAAAAAAAAAAVEEKGGVGRGGGPGGEEYESIVHSYFAALGGSLAGQMALGHRHLFGHGVPTSCDRARPYYELAANQAVESFRSLGGHYPGQLALPPADALSVRLAQATAPGGGGVGLLPGGRRGRESDREIVQYFEAATLTGDAHAALQLGNLYLNGGRGLPQDLHKAAKLFRRALDVSTAQTKAEHLKKKKNKASSSTSFKSKNKASSASSTASKTSTGLEAEEEEAAAIEEMSDETLGLFKVKKNEIAARKHQVAAAAKALKATEAELGLKHQTKQNAAAALDQAKKEGVGGSKRAAVQQQYSASVTAFNKAAAAAHLSAVHLASSEALLAKAQRETQQVVKDALELGPAPKAEAAAAAGMLGVLAYGGVGGVDRSEEDAYEFWRLGVRGPNGGDPVSLTGLGILYQARARVVVDAAEKEGKTGGAHKDKADDDEEDEEDGDDDDDDDEDDEDKDDSGALSLKASSARALEYFEQASKRGYMEGFYHLGMFHLDKAGSEGAALSSVQRQHTRRRAAAALKASAAEQETQQQQQQQGGGDGTTTAAAAAQPSANSAAGRKLKQQRQAKMEAASEKAKRERVKLRVEAHERRQAQRRAESYRRKQQRQRDAKSVGMVELDAAAEARIEEAEKEATRKEEEQFSREAKEEEERIAREAEKAKEEEKYVAIQQAADASEEEEVKERHKSVAAHLQKATQSLSTAAQHGHMLALHQLGVLYTSGRGVAPNCGTAVHAFKSVSERSGMGTSLASSALELWVKGDAEGSRLLYAYLAEMGYEIGQSNAAWILEHGHLLKPGLRAFARALSSGLREAASKVLTSLAPALTAPSASETTSEQQHEEEDGEVEEEEEEEEEEGDSACGSLGRGHECEAASLRLWKRAAQQNNPEAALKVGDYAYYGKGLLPATPPPSETEAETHADAAASIGEKKGAAADVEGIRPKKSASSSSSSSLWWWAAPPDEGDAAAAARHYQAAADLRHPQALFNLGWMYQWGVGVQADRHLAKRHLDSAAEYHPHAKWPSLFGLASLHVAELLFPLPTEGGSGGRGQRSGGGGEQEFDWGDEFKHGGEKEGEDDADGRSEGGEEEGWLDWLAALGERVSGLGGGGSGAGRQPEQHSRGGGSESRRGDEEFEFQWRDEIFAADTLVVLGLSTALLLVLQLRRHQRQVQQELNHGPAALAGEEEEGEGAPPSRQGVRRRRGGGARGADNTQRAAPPAGAYGVPMDE